MAVFVKTHFFLIMPVLDTGTSGILNLPQIVETSPVMMMDLILRTYKKL